jgi:hypothetical protein
MKYILSLFASALLFISCSTTKPIERSELLSGIDFRKYTENNFFITPLEYTQPYEPIGLINFTIYPAVKDVPSVYSNKDGYILTDANGQRWLVEHVQTSDAVDKIYKYCTEMKADALMMFDINVVYKNNGALSVPGLEITGFAIRRK